MDDELEEDEDLLPRDLEGALLRDLEVLLPVAPVLRLVEDVVDFFDTRELLSCETELELESESSFILPRREIGNNLVFHIKAMHV